MIKKFTVAILSAVVFFGVVGENNTYATFKKSSNTKATDTVNQLSPYEAELFDCARKNNNDNILREYMNSNGDINIRDNHERTLMHYFAINNNSRLLRLAIERPGTDINAKDKNGDTPLHLAVGLKAQKCVVDLLNNFAHVSEKDNSGNTPLHLAIDWGKPDVLKLLIQKGAIINSTNKKGKTALDLAQNLYKRECDPYKKSQYKAEIKFLKSFWCKLHANKI